MVYHYLDGNPQVGCHGLASSVTGNCPVFTAGPTRVTRPQLLKCESMGTHPKSPALFPRGSLSSLFQWHTPSLKENHGDQFHSATSLSP